MSDSTASLGQRVTAKLYQFVLWVLAHTHVKIVAIIGLGVGLLTWLLFAERRQIVARNLRIVIDPNLRPKQLRPLVRKNIFLTCMNFACALKVGIMSPEEMEKSIRVVGKEVFEDAGSEGRTGLACIPHAGNWEVLARIRPLFTKVEHFGSMYRRMSNPALEEIVYNCRTKFGCEMFSKEKDVKQAIRLSSNGGLLGILSDQYTIQGLYVPYFGKVTGTTPLPSLLKMRDRRGRVTAFSVFTRNRGLGKWDAVMDRTIEFEKNSINQMAANTISINQALERCQSENILDGFWMHHRWKSRESIAPEQPDGVAELAAAHTRLPFRILVALPEQLEESLCCIPALRVLKACRFDAQLILICPEAQQAFWQQSELASHVLSSDGSTSMRSQLEADEIYKDGPFDYLFMWSKDKAVLSAVRQQGIINVSGFTENPLSKKFNYHLSESHTGPAQHRYKDYLNLLRTKHQLAFKEQEFTCALAQGESKQAITFIAPFSTIGTCDSWPQEHWKELVAQLGSCQLLALEEHQQEAQLLAHELNIDCCITTPASLKQQVGLQTPLIGVDGSLTQLAALYGAPTSIFMASRLAKRYAPWLPASKIIYKHANCHPCYQTSCSASQHCLTSISAYDVIAKLRSN